ncbi:hypothetical protein OBBRIDRAFT_712920, partial [Obba rivulosa]
PLSLAYLDALLTMSRATTWKALALLTYLACVSSINAAPTSFEKQNALDAQQLNAQFATLKATDACTEGQQACVESAFAQCVNGTWTLTQCVKDTSCVALPLVNKPGTTISCDTQSDALQRFQDAGVQGGLTGNDASAASSAVPS